MIIQIIIYAVVAVVIYKISLALGILPYVIITATAIVGYVKFGILGLIIGVAAGYIVNILLAASFSFFNKTFDIGLLKKKDRRAIAESFYNKHEQEIKSLDKFKTLEEKEIIDIFAKHINQIHEFSIRLKDPVKKHSHDLNIAEYRSNFVMGGKNWAEHFDNKSEIELMQKYVDYCEIAIYEVMRL